MALRLGPYHWSLLLTQSWLLAEQGLTPEAMEFAKRAYELCASRSLRFEFISLACSIMERWSEGLAEWELS